VSEVPQEQEQGPTGANDNDSDSPIEAGRIKFPRGFRGVLVFRCHSLFARYVGGLKVDVLPVPEDSRYDGGDYARADYQSPKCKAWVELSSFSDRVLMTHVIPGRKDGANKARN
jgi:hypothetical protein